MPQTAHALDPSPEVHPLPSQDSLSLLHEVSRELSSILHSKKLLHRVAELIKGLIDYQLFGVLLYEPETETLKHAIAVSHNGCQSSKVRIGLGEGISGTAAALRRPVRVGDVRIDPRYVDCGDQRVRSELSVPMLVEDRLVGVVDLESYHEDAFGPEAEQLMSTLAANLAVALENARLYERLKADEQQMAKDLEAARQVQQLLLPRSSPWSPGMKTAVAWCPARHLGGDLYDFLPYDEHRTAYLVADVAGKGTGAALYGSMAVGMLRGYAADNRCDPSCVFAYLNDALAHQHVERRFLAAVFAVHDRRDHSITLANAGLPYPYLLRDGKAQTLEVAGVPVGALASTTYPQITVQLEPGDSLVLATDGIEEALNVHQEPFGEDRTRETLERLAHRSACTIAQGLLDAGNQFVGPGRDPGDDRTVVVIQRKPEG